MLKKLSHYWLKFTKKAKLKSLVNSAVHNTSKVEHGTEFNNSTMGKYSYCGYNCTINYTDIGSFCSISNDVIIGGGIHPIDWVGTSPVFYDGKDSVKVKFSNFKRPDIKRTTIGNDVWIGRNVMIKSGISIGHGAVVGMGSIVTKDVEPYAIVGGNPAKLIKFRFTSTVVSDLLNLKWWDMEEDQLKQVSGYVKDVVRFINETKKLKHKKSN